MRAEGPSYASNSVATGAIVALGAVSLYAKSARKLICYRSTAKIAPAPASSSGAPLT